MKTPVKIALLGTGMAAAAVHTRLQQEENVDIQVFDKSRGIGGRLATRYTDTHQFDHGAQFFTARTAAFQSFLQDRDEIAAWTPNITTLTRDQAPFKRIWYEPHYVATPRMNGLCRKVFLHANVSLGAEITDILRCPDGYLLQAKDGSRYGPFDRVISSAPAEQTARIFSSITTARFDAVRFDPCFALMVPLTEEDTLPSFDAAVVRDSPISWLAFTDSKPDRSCAPSMIAHSRGDWAREHLDDDPAVIRQQLGDALTTLTGLPEDAIANSNLHRWRYARTTQPLGAPFWLTEDNRLGACGDWCLGERVEDAFTSGMAIANAIIESL